MMPTSDDNNDNANCAVSAHALLAVGALLPTSASAAGDVGANDNSGDVGGGGATVAELASIRLALSGSRF